VVEQMMKTKCEAEFDASIDMAIERGKFSGFNKDTENKSLFVKMLKKELPRVHERMLKYGRRNISISTVAPTGTLSIMSQTSSGIEPVFMLSYKRRKKVNPTDKNVKIDFTDAMGDAWQEFEVYHHGLKKWFEATGDTDMKNSPYAGATATEIDWKKRVALQSVVQKYTTHSISSTINLPNDVNEQQVGDIYLNAWKQGLKGITVYREGSRSGVLVASDKKNEPQVMDTVPPKRPKILEAEVVRFMNSKEKWIAVIGLLNNRPYEIFTGKAEESFIIPEWVKKGWVIKNKNGNGNGRYDFQYMDSEGYKTTIEGLSRSFNPEYWNYAKLISGVLRHGMPLVHVTDLIENLNLDSDQINTWKNGVQRALKKYIPEGTEAKDKTCPSCGDTDGLVFEEGCLKCKSCGHSKCS
jgi:ribonucleoside-diphosphate reductase alpha chain